MAGSANFSLVFLLLAFSLFGQLAFSAYPPEISPAPSPESGADSPSPTAGAPAPLHAPASSPPAPSTETPSPGSSPSPSPGSSPSPSPSPSAAPALADHADVNHAGVADESEGKSSGGMSPGRKAGIAVGIIAAGCVVGLAGIVYKKRQQNIRRAQLGYAARREIL